MTDTQDENEDEEQYVKVMADKVYDKLDRMKDDNGTLEIKRLAAVSWYK